MTKLRILFLDQQSWRGGAQQVLDAVLGGIAGQIEPIVAFPDSGPFRQELTERGIKTITYPLGSYQPGKKSVVEILSFGFRTFFCGVRLIRVIVAEDIQLVYINGPRCLLAGLFASFLTRRPTLFHLHNIFTRRSDLFLVSRLARFATRVLACSNAAAMSLIAASPKLKTNTTVVYNCIANISRESSASHSRPRAPREDGSSTIGIVGRITPAKGHHVLLEALARLDPGPRAKLRLFVLGGPGADCREDHAFLNRLIVRSHELGLDKQIVWAGHVADVGSYYELMDAVVVPSVCEEGFSLVALEAMQRGIPVIASDAGGIPEFVQHEFNGLLVPPGNIENLKQAISRIILTGRDFEHQLGIRARATVETRFAPESFARGIAGLLTELISRSAPRGVCARIEEAERK